ncbi:MAG: hypothetical protein ACI9KE_005119 [Polyangiales bacterium]|jgi:hypothetical protein
MRYVLVITALLAVGCPELPPTRDARGLYVDLHKAVEFQAATSWVVDRLAVEELNDDIMNSVCQTTPEAREDLRAWINARFESEIGQDASAHEHPSELAYREEGSMTRRVERLRHIERVRMLLEAGDRIAAECPYWTEPDSSFAGIESDEGRVVILAESVGAGALRLADGDTGFGGGGGGALMLGFGIRRLTLGIGIELGADGTLPEAPDGSRSFEAVFSSAIPVLFRYTNISRVIDIQLSYRTLWSDTVRHGARASIGYGVTTPRVSKFMPYGLLWIGYEIFPSANGASTEHAFLIGTRVGLNWDP